MLLALETRVQSQNKIEKKLSSFLSALNAVLLSPLFIKSCIHRDPAPHSPQRSADGVAEQDGVAEVNRRRRFSI